jgi:glucose-1-phosphate thymidylyltransferase
MGHVVNSLGSGRRFGCHFTYRVQEEAGGIAHALSLAELFVASGPVVVLLGDNIFENSIAPYVKEFAAQDGGARVLLKEVADPHRFGIAALDEEHIISIEEKPAQPKSNYAVVGCYMYDSKLFDHIKRVELSDRGELEITSVNARYLEVGELMYSVVKGSWTDAGTFESLHEANQILYRNQNQVLP